IGSPVFFVSGEPKRDEDDIARELKKFGVRVVREDRRIVEVQISSDELRDSDVTILEGLLELKRLYLTASPISGKCLSSLKTLQRIEAINVCMTKFSDENVGHLASFPRLRKLHLAETEITDAAMPGIGKLRKLEELSLSYCDISSMGLK